MKRVGKKNYFFILFGLFLITMHCQSYAKDSPFGIGTFWAWNDDWNNYMYKNEKDIQRSMDALKDLNVSIIRNEFSWNEIETQKGIFEFKRYDFIVHICRENNVAVLGILGYTAPWTGHQWNSAPPDETLFLKYVETVVSRYKDSVQYWEFWNEPDSSSYWNPQDNMKEYTRLLKKVYVTIKKINPSAVVVLGGLTNAPYYSLKRVLSNGGGNYFDIVNIHPYVNPDKNKGIQHIQSLLGNVTKELEKKGLYKKIWLTEIACPGANQIPACAWWLGECQSEVQQEDFLKKVYSLLSQYENVEKIFWSMLRDTRHFNDGIDSFGLLRWDYTPKPAYFAYKKIIEHWSNQ